MPKPLSCVRTPIYLRPSMLRRLEALVAEFGCSRSAVVRAALERGLAAAARDLRSARAARLRDVGTPSGASVSAPVPSPLLTLEAAVEKPSLR